MLKRQLLRFLMVGAVSTGVNFGLFLLLLHFTSLGYSISSGAGYVIGVVVGFFLNRSWTYQADSPGARVMGLYALVYLVSLGETLAAMPLLVEVFHVNPVAANVLVLFLTTATNFAGTKYLVFRK